MRIWDRGTAADPVSAQKLKNQLVGRTPTGNVIKKVQLTQR